MNLRLEEQEQLAKQKLAAEEQGGIKGIGVAAMNQCPENFLNQAQTQDPRAKLLYSIGVRVDELLAQVSALREAERIIKNADWHTVSVLDRLMSGGLGR